MNDLLNAKFLEVVPPQAIKNNASWTANEIDSQGWGYLTLIFDVGAVDIAMSALKLQETSTSGSGYGDVTGAIYGTSANIDGTTSALPSATDDNKIFVIQVDLRARKRYLKPVLTIGTGATGGFVSCVAILTKPSQAPITAANIASGNVLRVA